MCGFLALSFSGCLHSASMLAPEGTSALRTGADEQSVRPGINASYESPDVEIWVERFESESREIAQHRYRIVESAGVAPGMVVADVGSGTGLFTPVLSEAVGERGMVLAVDIVPEFLELTRKRARKQGLKNVQTVLCDEDSVLLPRAAVDLVFTCDTYHHLKYPRSTLRSIHHALKPGGELVVIDFKRIPRASRQWVLDHVRAGRQIVTEEITAAGFILIQEPPPAPYLDENYLIRFRKVD